VNLFTLYLILTKATLTSFSGMGSLPVIHHDLVAGAGVLTQEQLSTAIAAGQLGPGPKGLYVVNCGYLAAGWPGAAVGWLAMVTPAFLVIPLARWVGRRAELPAVRRSIEAVVFAAAGLIFAAALPLARQAASTPVGVLIAAAAFLAALTTRADALWIALGAVCAGLAGSWYS